jgi:hypothetical protein
MRQLSIALVAVPAALAALAIEFGQAAWCATPTGRATSTKAE